MKKNTHPIPQGADSMEGPCSDKKSKFLQQIIDTIPSPIYYKDTAGRFRGGNKALSKYIMGVPIRDIIGRTMHELPQCIPPDLADIYHQADQALLKDMGVQIYEGEVLCADGIRREFQFNKAVLTNSRGEAIGVVGVMVDITSKNKAQKILTKEADRYRTFFDSGAVGIFRTNLDGMILTVNARMAEMFGFASTGDMIRSSAIDLYARIEDRQKLIAQLKETGFATQSRKMKKKDGTLIKTRIFARLEGDKITGYESELPIDESESIIVTCASCFRMREGGYDTGLWVTPSEYFMKYKEQVRNPEQDFAFSHSICPKCGQALYGDLYEE